jgi:isochorismate synthase
VSSAKPTSLLQFFNYCVQNNLPFAFYHMPETGVIKVIAQKHNKQVKNKNAPAQKGFLFAPFQEGKNQTSLLIAPDIFTSSDKLPALNFAAPSGKTSITEKPGLKEATKHQFISHVKNIQQEIKKGVFKKIVAARVVKKKKPKTFSPVTFFENLGKNYPAAFASLVYTPQHGLWIGASPEILLNVDESGFKTYSLAGTKANTSVNSTVEWGEKEQEEQKIVSQYITSAFKKVTSARPEIKGPETIAAGNLLHLRTTFIYPHIPKNKWPQVVAGLHPTPAVAGLPKKQSIRFIHSHEIANRNFYSGYLGPVNLDGHISLFVNLRCMKVLKNKLAVHVGCGITASSVPANEWKESKMKSETLLSVLKAD